MSDSKEITIRKGGSCLGCIVTIIFLWALIFGVTWGGKHYGLSCSSDEGVKVNGVGNEEQVE
jgi:hypothetical protein